MVRWIIVLLLLGSLLIVALPASTTILAQSTLGAPTTAPEISPRLPGYQPLVLGLQDSGNTFTVSWNTLIIVRIPRLPYAQLSYNPAVLRVVNDPIPLGSNPDIQRTPGVSGEWRFLAVAPGVSPLAIEQSPCVTLPCPRGMPAINFRVTIVVRGEPLPTFPPPPPLPVRSDQYIGTAHLDQTIATRVGNVINLDLPSLTLNRPVHLQFNPAVIMPFPIEDLRYPQAGGWHFRAVQTGTTPLIVWDRACSDSTIDCGLLFQVTISVSQ